ncbi:MAG: LptE family protein [Candidatus Marinimicrobia bacterium]|nr:LptE family protein [Candidatus Neomarinimicrobiota bacterium]MDP6593194.1 LptE family protein [Candidatus Neomarinimicrobiota bacterium]
MRFDERGTGIMERGIKASIITIITMLWLACGIYSFTGSIPPHIKSISIPLFVNETAEFGVAESITDEVTNTFLEENILKVVQGDLSDSQLKGTIKKVNDSPYTYSETEEVLEYRFSVTIQVEWFDVSREETLLKKNYSSWGAYSLTQDIASDGIDNDGDGEIDAEDPDETGDPRVLATKVAVGKISADIINDIVSTW